MAADQEFSSLIEFIAYIDQLKSAYLFEETARILPRAPGAKRICTLLGLPLTRFANIVESGVIPNHGPRNLRFVPAMPDMWILCWAWPDVDLLKHELAQDRMRIKKGEHDV